MNPARQTATTLDGIRRDHVARYEFASRIATPPVLDACCGVGYGASILADAGHKVFAVDSHGMAIRTALKHYCREGIAWVCADIHDAPDLLGPMGTVVAFECIEHIEDAPYLVASLVGMLAGEGTFIASVPNEESWPFDPDQFKHDDSPHLRHYTPAEFEALLREAGLFHVKRYTQHGKRGEVEVGDNGRFLVYVGKKL